MIIIFVFNVIANIKSSLSILVFSTSSDHNKHFILYDFKCRNYYNEHHERRK